MHVFGTESNSEERRDYVVGMRHLQDELAAGSHGTIFRNRTQHQTLCDTGPALSLVSEYKKGEDCRDQS